MIFKTKVVAKYYSLIVATLCVFFIMGFVSYLAIMKNMAAKQVMMPPLFVAKIVDILDKKNKINAIRLFVSLHNRDCAPSFELFNQAGDIIYPGNAIKNKISADALSKLTKPYEYTLFQERKSWYDTNLFQLLNPMPIPEVFLVRLAGHPVYYLKIFPPQHAHGKNKFYMFPIIEFASLFVALLLGVTVCIFLIYLSVVKHTKIADQVISELQKGNLKARFPLNRKDEFGNVMQRFNIMADEIERLVVCLKQDEKARINLLQELTHDLKTPIASLKMLLETLGTQDKSLSKKLKKELISLSRKEIDYFAKLIDDLLLLAEVSDPKYYVQKGSVDIIKILSEEVYDSEFRGSQENIKIRIETIPENVTYIDGDLHLLRRFFRNAIDNAISFARSEVTVDMVFLDKNKLQIIIQDDGPGFSPEALQSFGIRRLSRKLHKDQHRVSFGLGSVIMKTICQLHGGSLVVENVLSKGHTVIGGKLSLELVYEVIT
ncbi:MAG: HAMP domain-containing sensor histidine kinase [Gammaproteobacteria bacterium]|nr:HAMP domain-containing sensor histidine kinase [Gammaproteobacteria bacterium]